VRLWVEGDLNDNPKADEDTVDEDERPTVRLPRRPPVDRVVEEAVVNHYRRNVLVTILD
jgi:hypothetical protein